MKLRDYQPPPDLDVMHARSGFGNAQELRNMAAKVDEVLEGYSVESYFDKAFEDTIAAIAARFDVIGRRFPLRGRVLELGAGICKTSGVLASRHPSITHVTVVDFAENLLTQLGPRVLARLGADLGRFRFLVADMNDLAHLGDQRFDVVLMYATAHHLILPEHSFAQMYGVLNEGGIVVCINEPALSNVSLPSATITAWTRKMTRLRHEGDNENIYRVRDYERFADRYFETHHMARKDGGGMVVRTLRPLYWRALRSVSATVLDITFVLTRRPHPLPLP